MRMKLGQRKIDIKGIKAEEFKASPVMTKNLGWINGIVGKSKPAKIDMKIYKEAQAKVNSYKPQANLSYLTNLLSK